MEDGKEQVFSYDVLLVEDDSDQRKLIIDMLQQVKNTSFIVSEADSLKFANKLLAKSNFDIILLDLNLPDSSESSTLDVIYQNYSSTPIIVITSLKATPIKYKVLHSGAECMQLIGIKII